MVLLSFIDNLGFIALSIFVKKIAKILKKISKIILQYGKKNAVTYNIGKIKFILFFKTYSYYYNYQLQEIIVFIVKEQIKFNKKAIRWLRVWLDG